jgi:hypothetical protein
MIPRVTKIRAGSRYPTTSKMIPRTIMNPPKIRVALSTVEHTRRFQNCLLGGRVVKYLHGTVASASRPGFASFASHQR